jgi:hypothetical protein
MNDTLKKALIIFGGGFIIFWLFKDKGIKNTSKEEKIDAPNIDPKELANKNKKNAFPNLEKNKNQQKKTRIIEFVDCRAKKKNNWILEKKLIELK